MSSLVLRILTWLAVAAMVASLVAAVVWGYEHWRQRVYLQGDAAGAARVQRLWDDDRARAQEEALEAAQAQAKETQRVLARQRENQLAQDDLVAQIRRDRAAALAAVDLLQQRANAYLDAAGCSALQGDSALECVRQAAVQVIDVLGRCAARHQQLAEAADDARSRGLKCEADYDALSAPAAP